MTNGYSYGNRCGFNPKEYRLPDPLPHEARSRMPKFILQIQNDIVQNGIPGIHVRGERDEAVRALAIELLNLTDIWSCKTGIPTKNGWMAFSWGTVLKRLPWLSQSRLWEALKILREHGIYESSQRIVGTKRKQRDHSKPSGYAVSDKGFTEAFWAAFRQQKRWKREAEAKARRITDKATKIGKTLQDFYRKIWCSTSKGSVKAITAAGMQQKTGNTTENTRPSANAIKMQLVGKLLQLGVKDADERAYKLFAEFGADALVNTEQFVS